MAATIGFFAGEDFEINDLEGSGLGFYGPGFGVSVPVGGYQNRTFITDSTGAVEGAEVDNVQFYNASSGIVGQTGSGIPLTAIPNYLATLNIRFTNDIAVKTQNAKLIIYDRSSIVNPPSGVTCKVASIIHPDIVQNDNGSGSSTWATPSGSANALSLAASPGTSGLSPSGPNTVDTQHDWFVAISASPDSIGSKTLFSLYVSLEYL